MATEVSRPRGCLIDRIGFPPATAFSRRKTPAYYGSPSSTCSHYYNSFIYPNPNPSANPRSSRRSAAEQRKLPTRRPSADDLGAGRQTAGEKVTILRRGESLDSKIKSDALRRDSGGDVYAGSAFVVSPSPSSLPLPSFSRKKLAPVESVSVDDSATRDLRRLLRIG